MSENHRSTIERSKDRYNPIRNSLKLPQEQMDALIDAHLRLYRQIEQVNRKWFARLSETHDAEIALGKELLDCPNPLEGEAKCRAWIQHRGALFASDMQNFTSLWLDFCDEMATESQAGLSSGSQVTPSA